MTVRIGRWEAGVAATAVLAAVGLVNGKPALLLAAGIPLAYLAYGAASTVSIPDGLAITRRVEPSTTAPDRPVSVELAVANESDRAVADVRVVDGVPESLAVVDGTPRGGTTLAPGESTTMTYTVIPRRGEHEFDDPRIRVRDAAASAMETASLPVAGDDTLHCRLDAGAPPLADEGTGFVGSMTADRPGRGIEFHSTREYRSGDPAARIDWRHYAKRGELTTVNYARRLATTVVAVVDARESCRAVAGPGHPTAVELSAYAATRALTDLLRTGHDVGVAVLGLDGDGPADLVWLPPGGGSDQRSLALEALGDAIDADPSPAVDVTEQVRKVVELAAPGAQLALFSPALDDGTVEAVETWAAFDHSLVVCSPDVVAANTVGGQFDQLRRRARLARCQAIGARTVDWRRGTPLQVVLEQAFVAGAKTGGAQRAGGARGGESP